MAKEICRDIHAGRRKYKLDGGSVKADLDLKEYLGIAPAPYRRVRRQKHPYATEIRILAEHGDADPHAQVSRSRRDAETYASGRTPRRAA